MAAKIEFHLTDKTRVLAGSVEQTGTVFLIAREDGASVSLFMPLEAARALVERLAQVIRDADEYAAFKARKAEAA